MGAEAAKVAGSPITLPTRSRPTIVLALAASIALLAWYALIVQPPLWMWIPIFLVSGLIADAITAILHFCFDYVFPFEWPVFGPISREFNEHHDDPSLDPDDLVENFTKGAYASVLACLLSGTLLTQQGGEFAVFVQGVFVAFCFWALLFHQTHSYAHMGASLPTEVFCNRAAEIARFADVSEQRRELKNLFASVPVPPLLRALQTLRLTLSPERHNVHHVRFERDFSSLNGWSDPILNLLLTPLARRLKPRRHSQLRERGWPVPPGSEMP